MRDIRKFVLDVRNILSLSVAVVYVVLSLKGVFTPDQVMGVIITVFAFYLGRETGKTSDKGVDKNV